MLPIYSPPQNPATTTIPTSLLPRSNPTLLSFFTTTMRLRKGDGGGLGIAAVSYVFIDYLRHLSPSWHQRLQPLLWTVLALIAITRVPFYRHWSAEIRAAIPFVASLIFMLSTFLVEVLSVRFVTAVLGLTWHSNTPPLPDTGQWMLMALSEKLPDTIVGILRARFVGLHHFLMLFIMLAFSVLFDSVEAPGLGLGARYMFTMAVGRLLRTIAFVTTILPSPRPWCAAVRYKIPAHPHHWAQKYYVPYASDSNAISQVIRQGVAYADTGDYIHDYRPDWGSMSFLIDFLRPTEEGSWYSVLKKAEGGCNDLVYSGHLLVAVLTAMAWTEAYGGYSSACIWMFVLHSAQREVRERNHYTVDCVVAIYVGILIWKMTGFIWPPKDASRRRRLSKLDKIQSRLVQAAKDSDIDKVNELLKEVEFSSQESQDQKSGSARAVWLFACATTVTSLTIVLLAFKWTSDG